MCIKNLLGVALLSLIAMIALGQNGTIRGTVTTSDGQPAEYVNVSLKGTVKGSVTDKNGAYEIRNVHPGNYKILVSIVGAASQEKIIEVEDGKSATLDFILTESAVELEAIIVREDALNRFYLDQSQVVSKMPLQNLENPQVYNSISHKLLKEQVITNINDAIKNATGVTRLWESTGRGGDGAEYYTMRGFAVQPTIVNGMPSVTNGSLDPANIESMDVIKGPSGTLFGSPMISYGGLINVTTRKPFEFFAGELGIISGSNGLNRLTADVNVPLSETVLARVNTAYQLQNSFQDAGFRKSLFIAPSFTIKSSERLTFLVNVEMMSLQSVNAPMIFLNRYAPLTFNKIDVFEKNYEKSFTSNDLSISNPTMTFQAQARYQISDSWLSQTVLSRSHTSTDGYYQYLWDFGDGDTFGRYISRRNGETNTTDIQQNFIGDFKVANLRNRVVIGFDYFKSNILNSSTGWVLNGQVTLSDANDSGVLTSTGVDNLLVDSFEGNSDAEQRVFSAYASDVINVTPSLSAMASIRVDRFEGRTAYWNTSEVKDQSALSPKFGIVYQPLKDKVSLFANYQNGFVNVAPTQVADVDGSNPRLKSFDPEHANQVEFGVKTNVFRNRIAATASYYNIIVKNRVMTDPTNVNNSVQGGEVESKGFELSLVANPIDGLNLVAGFSDNHAEVTKDNPGDGYVGLRPEEAGPEQLLNFWASYTVQKNFLKGFGFGIGGNYASEHKTLNRANTGTFTLPSYMVLNASLSYTGCQYSIFLKVNNLSDVKYYSGWSTVTPQNLRNISLSLNYKF